MFNRVLSFTRHKFFFMKLIAYMLLLCMVPIIALVFFFYYNVQTSMKREIVSANDRYLNQTVNAMELVVNQIGNGYRHFATSNSLTVFDRSPLGNYFAEIARWRVAEDKQSILNYIESKANVLKSLVDLSLVNDFIYSVHYINPGRGIVLTSGALQFELAEFYDRDWDATLQSDEFGYPIMMNVRDAPQQDGSVKRVIPIVFRTAYSNYTVVINLDAETFYSNLIRKLREGNGASSASLIVFSREGEPLLYENDSTDAEQIESARSVIAGARLDRATDSQSNEFVTERGRHLISMKSSALLGWQIASVTDLNAIYGNVSSIRNVFITLTLLLLVTITVLSFVSGRRLYRPISKLLQFVSAANQGVEHSREHRQVKHTASKGNAKRLHGEFQVISESLTNLQLRLRESLPAHKEKFIRSLLNKHAFSREAIEERLDFLQIGLQTTGIGLILIATEADGQRKIDIEAEKLEHLLVIDSIDLAIDPRYPKWVNEHAEHLFLALINCGENGISAVFAVAEAIKASIRANHSIACTLGIGSYCRTIEDLPQAYKEAKEALAYRNMSDDSEVIYIDEVRLQSYTPLPYPKDKEETLLLSIKNGDREQALAVFADMVREMRGETAKIGFSQVQQAFLQLLVKLMEMIGELRLDRKEIVPDERPHYLVAFLEKNDWQEMTEWFRYMIEACASQIGHALREKKNMHVERVLQMVASDCGETASLAAVAETLNLNPTYLGRIFKEHAGVTFTEYMTQLRIAKSKELLLLPELKIQDISKQLGYIKVDHFIKLFKEATGLTPGEFRKQLH
ncbi:helix-turn-helix domain-containing protein [Paenibacillus cymbidii]|uniref:helix-turn-helix domain-containing protein n=1 Tax=Paenibacillus cymbidii TaxID=1639034 RepID=UPI001436A72D|nr:helix-turn-helix domain-containing protein [Paenibacillus cymbidii]